METLTEVNAALTNVAVHLNAHRVEHQAVAVAMSILTLIEILPPATSVADLRKGVTEVIAKMNQAAGVS